LAQKTPAHIRIIGGIPEGGDAEPAVNTMFGGVNDAILFVFNLREPAGRCGVPCRSLRNCLATDIRGLAEWTGEQPMVPHHIDAAPVDKRR
jgi:hypothetical protein